MPCFRAANPAAKGSQTRCLRDPPREVPVLLAAAIDELKACDKRSTVFGKMIVGQEVWRLLLTLDVEQNHADPIPKRLCDFADVKRGWLGFLASEGMREADATNRLRLSDQAVRCVEQCLAY